MLGSQTTSKQRSSGLGGESFWPSFTSGALDIVSFSSGHDRCAVPWDLQSWWGNGNKVKSQQREQEETSRRSRSTRGTHEHFTKSNFFFFFCRMIALETRDCSHKALPQVRWRWVFAKWDDHKTSGWLHGTSANLSLWHVRHWRSLSLGKKRKKST